MIVHLLLACADHGSAGDPGYGTADVDLHIDDEHQWSWVEQLDYPRTAVPPGDACFDWSAVTRNARGDEYTPEQEDRPHLFHWDATADAVSEGQVDADDLIEATLVVDGPRSQSFCVHDLLPRTTFEEGDVWSLYLTEHQPWGDVTGALITVEADAPAAPVVLTNDSIGYTFVPTFGAPLVSPPGRPNVNVDWSGVFLAGDGHNQYSSEAQTALVALRFDVALADLPGMLDAYLTAADRRYEVPIGDTLEASLDQAVDAVGAPFPGFDERGVWVVAITCTDCNFVPPPILAVVDVIP